jgi:hypothetical protein
LSILSANGNPLAVPDAPASGEPGAWGRDDLIEMDTRFVAALEDAFRVGLERRSSACAEYRVARGSPGGGAGARQEEARWGAAVGRDFCAGVGDYVAATHAADRY